MKKTKAAKGSVDDGESSQDFSEYQDTISMPKNEIANKLAAGKNYKRRDSNHLYTVDYNSAGLHSKASSKPTTKPKDRSLSNKIQSIL